MSLPGILTRSSKVHIDDKGNYACKISEKNCWHTYIHTYILENRKSTKSLNRLVIELSLFSSPLTKNQPSLTRQSIFLPAISSPDPFDPIVLKSSMNSPKPVKVFFFGFFLGGLYRTLASKKPSDLFPQTTHVLASMYTHQDPI